MAERSPLFADRRAYRQIGYAPSDGFPIANAAAAAIARAGQVMEQQPAMTAQLLAAPEKAKPAPAAPGGGAPGKDAPDSMMNVAALAFPNLARVLSGAKTVLQMVSNASETDALKGRVAAPAPAKAAPATAVEQALVQGRAAPVTMTPQDAVSNAVMQAIANGVSYNELKGYGEMLPAVVKPTATAKDRGKAAADAIADTLYQGQLAIAQKMPEGAEKDAAITKATEEYWARYSGTNPLQLAQAALMAPRREEE